MSGSGYRGLESRSRGTDGRAALSTSPLTARQDDLFEGLGPAIDNGFVSARRIELDETSWLEHVPGWLRASGGLFDELMATAPWQQRYRYMWARRVQEPRLTAEYQDIAAVPQQLLRAVASTLSRHYCWPPLSMQTIAPLGMRMSVT